MENKLKSDERGSLSSRRRGLTRREWVQRMLAGAAMAGPALGASPPAHAQAPTPREASAQAQPAIVPPEWKPVFSDDHQNQTVISLAERIVPGSTATQANRFLDTALAAETQEKQQRFIAALNALEGESLRRFTKPIHELSANQQDQLLVVASTMPPSNPNALTGTAVQTTPGTESSAPNLRDYFDHLKQWIGMAYYSSEAGMKELGWKGQNFFAGFPGCQPGSDHS